MDTKKLRQKILELAIEGKLVPQNPDDEPASVLLEKIAKEKQRLIKEGKIKKDKNESFIFRGEDNCYYEKFISTGEIKNIDEQIPFEIPSNWAFIRLKDVCLLLNGEEKTGNRPCLDAKFLRGKSPATLLETGKFVAKGDNIILVDGENSGEVFTAPQDGYLGSTFKLLWLCHPMHIPFVLSFIRFYKETLRNSKKGAAIPHLNKELFYNLLIGIPPLAEQKRIVEKVERWFAQIDEIEKNKSDLQTAIKQTKAKVLELAIEGKLVPQNPDDEPAIELLRRINPDFTPSDNGHYPKGWCGANIDNLFFHNTGKALNVSKQEGNLMPYLTTSNVYWGKFDFRAVKQMRFKEEELSKCTISKGDLLVCEGGDVGRSAIWPFDYNICIQNHIHRLRPKCELCVPYAFYVMKYSKDHNIIGGKGMGLLGLSAKTLGRIVIPLPPLAEQKRIVQRIEEIFGILDNLEKSLQV